MEQCNGGKNVAATCYENQGTLQQNAGHKDRMRTQATRTRWTAENRHNKQHVSIHTPARQADFPPPKNMKTDRGHTKSQQSLFEV